MPTRRRIFWGALAAGLIMLVIVAAALEKGAEENARAFCGRFPAGSSLADAASAASGAGDPRYRAISPASVSVGYIGIPPFSRHLCVLDGEGGKVASARYVYLD